MLGMMAMEGVDTIIGKVIWREMDSIAQIPGLDIGGMVELLEDKDK